MLTGRTSVATAELLGQQVSVFPSHHGGFLDGEFGYAGKPDEFAHRLRQVLDGAAQANRWDQEGVSICGRPLGRSLGSAPWTSIADGWTSLRMHGPS